MLKRKSLVIILTALLICSLSFNVLGAGTLIDINAQMDTGIKIMLNGKAYAPKDPQDGSTYAPIIYKGRIYLPIRPVAEDIGGMKVTWDGNTRTAYLGDVTGNVGTNELQWFNATPEFTNGAGIYYTKARTPAALTTASGKAFDFGYTYHEPGWYAGYSLRVDTDFQYHKFKATFWFDEEKEENGQYSEYPPELEFRDENGILVKSFDVEWGKLYEVELDVLDVRELHIWASGSKTIIGEPKIGKP